MKFYESIWKGLLHAIYVALKYVLIIDDTYITYGAKVLVQNTCSFFSNSETTSENQKQLVRLRIFRSFRIWVQKFCVSFCYGIMKESLKDLERQFGQKCFSYILKIRIRNQMLKLLLIYQFVELNLLYKMHYFTLFLSFKKVPSFSFFSMILILRKAPFLCKHVLRIK